LPVFANRRQQCLAVITIHMRSLGSRGFIAGTPDRRDRGLVLLHYWHIRKAVDCPSWTASD
jgi:hypothetical protein